MKFNKISLTGAFLIEMEPIVDNRGFFARTWCADEFKLNGLNPKLAQCSVSFNVRKGTLRGMHYQDVPFMEAKLVRCSSGGIYDVIVDLRPKSPTFGKWFAAELTSENRKMIYVPEGFAHGFQTIADNTEVIYQISETYHPESARGIRWNDPRFGIKWPIENPLLSERDAAFPEFTP
jgi:dTDP-4-dehydrorhamnose 3,5-epimerase